MQITLNNGFIANGFLTNEIKELDGISPYLEIDLKIANVTDPAKVLLSDLDIFTIVSLAKKSKIQKIRDAAS